ncbi:MAG: SIMPL domain-containing protein [Bacillota bacterium]|nr:SIMPL domain-containing protein [Bacillota bacterium]
MSPEGGLLQRIRRRPLAAALAAAALALAVLAAIAGLPGLPGVTPHSQPAALAAATGSSAGGAGAATVSASGSGSVQATPDWATLQVGVRTRAASAQAAAEANAGAVQKLIQALRQAGVDAKEIRTSEYSLGPVYGTGGPSPAPSGYEAVHTLSVGVPADRAGAVLDAATQAGANQAGGVVFDVRDRTSLERQATNLAIDDARGRAEAAAQQAGLRLTGIRSLQLASGGVPIPFGVRAVEAASAAVPVPVQPGQLTVTATVDVVFDAVPAH